jgi:hypothetical protein
LLAGIMYVAEQLGHWWQALRRARQRSRGGGET